MIVGIVFFLLMLIGAPIAIALGVAGITGMYDMGGAHFASLAPSKIFNGLNIFPFLAMPFFILAGEIMNHTGITNRLVYLSEALVGHFRGGLAHSNMVASVFFSGITGSATADAAAFGRTLVPAMVKQGYSKDYACAVTAAGSIIGPTIPPSGLMVVYGSLMGVSIGGLFATGILPGILVCLVCMAIIGAMGKRKNLPKMSQKASLAEVLDHFKNSALALLMPLIILGGIVFGIVTPTEAASIAVAYALIIGTFIYRNLTLDALFQMVIRTAQISAVIYLIIGSASILGWWLSFNQIPQMIADMFISLSDNPHVILALIIALLLTVGMIMDINVMLIILAPILVPLTMEIGMDPLHAGIVFILALNISLMTPPIGACLFVLSSVTGAKIESISKELMPFLIGQLLLLFAIAFFPDIVLFIPRLLGY
ncbi:TRAP transporter large permease [Vibrio europaeus]|uniref:TRAP transporter large permease protein n=1 Tax=Vibrio europaeus TaxID=300876 RepID=A0AAE7AX26_9VIBR|nr:TRAP transporter large permease [Vibrio europaeus]MDC5811084.1 TRAP transporter large permease [Vibrio europaeus]QJY38342.1 TRAP transporter large permease [Vibrio europaeus]QPG33359.1 TRAP transporter large permease [Vibrio europaeus]